MKKVILYLLLSMLLSVSTAFAEVNYTEDANTASENITTIFTVCPGMSYKNVTDNFNGVTEWAKYEHEVTNKNGDSVVDMCFVKGTEADVVTERVHVKLLNGIVSSVSSEFYTRDEAVANEIYNLIAANVKKQIPCTDKDINGFKNVEGTVNNDERLVVRFTDYERQLGKNFKSDAKPASPENIEAGRRFCIQLVNWGNSDYRPHNATI